MRLDEYTQHRRGSDIPEKIAKELLLTKHRNSVEHTDTRIYRGVYGYKDYAYIDASQSKEPRISRDTYNYYTLMMDNFLSWRGYPKRSESIICTTDFGYADNMGDPYYVFPENGAKIGVCPDEDIWASSYGEFSFTNIVDSIDYILNRTIEYRNNTDIRIYGELIKAFQTIDEEKENIDIDATGYYQTFWDMFYNSGMTFLEYMQDIMKPDKFGFNLVRAGSSIDKDREVWISAPCVLVKCEGKLMKRDDIMSRMRSGDE